MGWNQSRQEMLGRDKNQVTGQAFQSLGLVLGRVKAHP